jgi:hypothetical protein
MIESDKCSNIVYISFSFSFVRRFFYRKYISGVSGPDITGILSHNCLLNIVAACQISPKLNVAVSCRYLLWHYIKTRHYICIYVYVYRRKTSRKKGQKFILLLIEPLIAIFNYFIRHNVNLAVGNVGVHQIFPLNGIEASHLKWRQIIFRSLENLFDL